MTELSVREAGKIGGEATKSKFGLDYYKRIRQLQEDRKAEAKKKAKDQQ